MTRPTDNEESDNNSYSELDYLSMMNAASEDEEIFAADPWTMDEFIDTYNQLGDLLTTGRAHLAPALQSQVRELIILGQSIQHPEVIDADFLGLYTINLMRLLDTPNPNEEEMVTILNSLSRVFHEVYATEQNVQVIMVVTDIHYNNTDSIFSNLFEQNSGDNVASLPYLSNWE